MATIYRVYKRRGLFNDKGENDEDVNDGVRETIESVVMKIYNTYNQTALRYCEGDLLKAKKFLDVNITEYYEGLVQLKDYGNWHSEQIKNLKYKK